MSEHAQPPSQLTVTPRTLIGVTLGAVVIGALIVLGAILPAEFHSDPLGIGKLTGIARIWSPPEKKFDVNSGSAPLAREYATPFRSDEIEIPLTGFLGGANGSELEYKFRMKEGATLIYAWEATGAERPKDLSYDFHGHTTPAAGSKDLMQVATYKQSYGLKQQGALTAPFDGIQGWQFSNGGDTDVVIHLKVSGFYELIPPGETGNEAGIIANVPANQARPGYKRPDH
ncbi:MAG: hypothetical protein GC155_15575 [Alphaproteobacteria bacterium]|nr:hypothetical protein [Alphaproteobacteria bacterium]